MLRQSAHQTFHCLILNQTDPYQARVLQTRGEKMDAPAAARDELHFDLSKIVLTEFPREAFETNQRLGRLRAQRGQQRVQSSLAPLIACLPHSSQNLQRR